MKFAQNELARYLIAGIFNTLVGYCVFLIMLKLIGLNPFYSNAVSYIIGLITAYFMNLLLVFKTGSHSRESVFRFVVGFAISFSLNLVVLNASLSHLKFQPEFSQIFAMCSYTFCFYLTNKHFVWVK